MTPAADVVTRKPLRLWPGVVAVVLMWIGFLLPAVAPDAGIYGLAGAAVCALAVLVWWLFFSRAPWLERVGALVLMPLAVAAIRPVVHPTIARAGMGNMLYVLAVPVLCLVLVAWAAATRRLSAVPRRAWLVAALLLGCSVFALIRTGGMSGEGRSDFHWRWTPTPEDRLLAQAGREPLEPAPAPAATAPVASPPPPAGESRKPSPAPPAAAQTLDARREGSAKRSPEAPPPVASGTAGAEWPGFRGPGRDAVIHGVRIATDWSASPPVELWRRAIGPGWSSFAVQGGLVYTQEQRGEEELVSCYRLETGKPVWRHGDAIRHWDSEGGPGPRATPTLQGGRVYALGATGTLNALDALSGALVWSRNAAAETGVERPGWGFAGSPLVVGDVVIVAASGRLAAYDAASGERRWLGPARRTLDERRAGGRRAAVGAHGGAGRQHRPAGADRGGRRARRRGRHDGGERPAPPRGRPRGLGVERRGALDVERPEAVLQRLRRTRGARLRVRRNHPRVHRPSRRHAKVERRPLRRRPARSASRPGPALRGVGGRRAGARQGDARRVR
jgi:hypothetical protein